MLEKFLQTLNQKKVKQNKRQQRVWEAAAKKCTIIFSYNNHSPKKTNLNPIVAFQNLFFLFFFFFSFFAGNPLKH